MTRVQFSSGDIFDGFSIGFDKELAEFQIVIGDYYVQLDRGNIVMRPLYDGTSANVLLSVPATKPKNG